MSILGDGEDSYIESFCKNINVYGTFEDITTLATCVDRPLHSPMLISTLTRKFYFIDSCFRGYNHVITERQKNLSEEAEKLKNLVVKLADKDSIKTKEHRKLESKPSFLKKIFKNGSTKSDNMETSKEEPVTSESTKGITKQTFKRSTSTETDRKSIKTRRTPVRNLDVSKASKMSTQPVDSQSKRYSSINKTDNLKSGMEGSRISTERKQAENSDKTHELKSKPSFLNRIFKKDEKVNEAEKIEPKATKTVERQAREQTVKRKSVSAESTSRTITSGSTGSVRQRTVSVTSIDSKKVPEKQRWKP